MSAPGTRILYIDDDPGLCRLVQKDLERQGHVVELATDGASGVARIAQGGIDVVALGLADQRIARRLVDEEMEIDVGLDHRGDVAARHRAASDIEQQPAALHDAEAHRLYARGRYFYEKRTADSLHRSIYYFRRAIAADERFGQAYAGLASAYVLSGEYLLQAPTDAFPSAARAARTACATSAAV